MRACLSRPEPPKGAKITKMKGKGKRTTKAIKTLATAALKKKWEKE